MVKLVAIALLCCAATVAAAQPTAPDAPTPPEILTAGALEATCSTGAEATQEVRAAAEQACSSYLRGLTDGLYWARKFAERGSSGCLTPYSSDTIAEAKRLLSAYLAANPKYAVNSAGLVAGAAIVQGHPCP